MIDELAGRLRIDPGPFTLRELVAMDRARAMEAWNHTAWLCATFANFMFRLTPLEEPIDVAKFHPLRCGAKQETAKQDTAKQDTDEAEMATFPFETFCRIATGTD